MKAIETVYGNYRFRSRIEARWAYVFDLLGVKYEYEKEGFELPAGRYLPDFWLSDSKMWLEIKGEYPTEREMTLAMQLSQSTKKPALLVYGAIPDGNDWPFDADSAHIYFGDHGSDTHYNLCECPDCGLVGFEFGGRSDRLPCKKGKCPTHAANGDKTYTANAPRIQMAYLWASRARFEHGETPIPRKLGFNATPMPTTQDIVAEFLMSRPQISSVNYEDLPF